MCLGLRMHTWSVGERRGQPVQSWAFLISYWNAMAFVCILGKYMSGLNKPSVMFLKSVGRKDDRACSLEVVSQWLHLSILFHLSVKVLIISSYFLLILTIFGVSYSLFTNHICYFLWIMSRNLLTHYTCLTSYELHPYLKNL